MAAQIVLVGVAQDAGVPQIGCYCANCTAVRDGRLAPQCVVSAAVISHDQREWWLIDCSPDVKTQYDEFQRQFPGSSLRGVLISHVHMGHYIGLAQFGREAFNAKGLNVHATTAVCNFLRANEPWRTYTAIGNFTLNELTPGAPLQLSAGLTATPHLVPHRGEWSDTVAFEFRGPGGTSALYCPDIDGWRQWQLQTGRTLREALEPYDLAFLDGCFYDPSELPGRDLSKIPHPFVVDTLAALKAPDANGGGGGGDVVAAAATAQGVGGNGGEPGSGSGREGARPDVAERVVLIHMNHSNPLWDRGSAAWAAVAAAGVRVGEQGARYEL